MNRIVLGFVITAVSLEAAVSGHGHTAIVPNVHVPQEPPGPLIVRSVRPATGSASFGGPEVPFAGSPEIWDQLARLGLQRGS